MKTLEKINWLETYSVENDIIDTEHKELIEIYNRLVNAVENNTGSQEYSQIIQNLISCSLLHFKMEDEYMDELYNSGLFAFKKTHKNFVYKIAMINVELSMGYSVNMPGVCSYLKKWLESHLITESAYYHRSRMVETKIIQNEAVAI
jgi:hemerythrin-like metal-binding protein